jgi:glycosyltransferase involved in cell wall biosynthesis
LKKILFYTDSKEFGGAEHYLSIVLRQISSQKFIPLYFNSSNLPRLVLLIMKERPDIVHFNLSLPYSCAPALMICGFFKKIRATAAVHSVGAASSRFPFIGQLKKMIALKALKSAKEFICVSQKSKETFCNNFNIPPDKVAVIYNGVDLFDTEKSGKAENLKKSLGINTDERVIGSISRLVKNKGLEDLLKAVSNLKGKEKLLIVGDGPLRGKLTGLAMELGIQDRVVFTGHQKEVLPFLLAMDIFVMPSLSESMPFALMEAMAAGRAVISTDVGGVKELVKDGENGLLVPAGDPDKLCDAVSLLSSDIVKMAKLGIAAKKTIEEKFSIEAMMRKTEDFFDSVAMDRS